MASWHDCCLILIKGVFLFGQTYSGEMYEKETNEIDCLYKYGPGDVSGLFLSDCGSEKR